MQGIKALKLKENSMLQSLVGGAFSLTLSTIIVKILGLIYKIPLSSLLGDEGMGYFNSAYTVYAFFYLLCTAGVPKAVMILISEAKAKGKDIEADKVVRVASVMFLSLGIVVTTVFVLFSQSIAALIGNSKSAFTMIAIAPSIIFISLSGVIRGFLSANMRLLDVAVSQIIEGVGKLVLGLAFAHFGSQRLMPLEIISALTILGVTFGSVFGLIYLLVCSKIEIRREKIGQNTLVDSNRRIAGRILAISIPITVSAAVMSITNLIDLGLIMRSLVKIGYSEGQASALYGNYTTLAVPMLNLAMAIISPISIAYLPTFTDCSVKGDSELLEKTQRNALDLTAFISAPVMIGLFLFSKEILDLLFKNSETTIGAFLLCLISPAILFSSLLVILNTILEGYGRVKAPLISMLFGSLAKVVVSYFLITRSELGIYGAPIGTVASYAVALGVSLVIYSSAIKRHIPLFSSCLMPHLNALVAVGLARIAFDRVLIDHFGAFALVLAILFAAIIYLVLSLFIGQMSLKNLFNWQNNQICTKKIMD